SHDLRTPVAAIQAMLEAAEDGLASIDEYLPALREQTRTLSTLIDDLFELARIDAGALTLELRETQLAEVVAECVRGLEAEARAPGSRWRRASSRPRAAGSGPRTGPRVARASRSRSR